MESPQAIVFIARFRVTGAGGSNPASAKKGVPPLPPTVATVTSELVNAFTVVGNPLGGGLVYLKFV